MGQVAVPFPESVALDSDIEVQWRVRWDMRECVR